LAPELIEPGSILDMSQSELEALISTIRERRNRVIQARSVAHHRARASGVLALRPKLEKLALRLDKAIAKLDAQLARCEGMVSQVVAMRLELGDATPSELASELRAAGTLRVVPPPSNVEDDDEGDEGLDNDHGEDVSVSQEQCDDHDVSGSQERPQPGIDNSESL
jgi:hypothetical protein